MTNPHLNAARTPTAQLIRSVQQMDRRTFLRLTAGAGAAGLLAACGGGSPASPTPSSSAAAGATTTPGAVAKVAPDAAPVLSVISASFEQLTGRRPFAFGIVGEDNVPVTDAAVELWAVPENGEPAGPFPTQFHDVPGQPLGLYVTEVELTQEGVVSFVAVTEDGRAGSDAIQVASPETSQLPAPGTKAIKVATPTKKKDLGFEKICTLDPPCGMHQVSLDQALADGRPIALAFATPAFCETAVCGPSVGVLEEVRKQGGWGDVVFIHSEIYSDAGQTLGKPVEQWNLPSEPWLFTIGADGVIEDRTDGPLMTLPDQVAELLKAIS